MNTLPEMVSSAATEIGRFGSALSDNILLVAAGAVGIFFAGEALARMSSVRDSRAKWIADRFGVQECCVTPIADGVQLFRDAGGDVGSQLPRGCPTLQGVYLVRTKERDVLAAVHSVDPFQIYPDDEDEDLFGMDVEYVEPAHGRLVAGTLWFSPEADLAQRLEMLSCIIARRLKSPAGEHLQPAILAVRAQGVESDVPVHFLERGWAHADGRSILHFDLDHEASLEDGLRNGHRPQVRLDESQLAALRRFLLAQPARVTPWSKLVRRALLGAACLAAWHQTGDAGVSDALLKVIEDLAP
jgi:hypothetical protein